VWLAPAAGPRTFVQHISNVGNDYQNGIFTGTNNLIETIGDRTPMTVEKFVISRKGGFQHNGPLFVPAAGTWRPARSARPPARPAGMIWSA
jgi:NAD(P)H dehydrogenase (quinone)